MLSCRLSSHIAEMQDLGSPLATKVDVHGKQPLVAFSVSFQVEKTDEEKEQERRTQGQKEKGSTTMKPELVKEMTCLTEGFDGRL